MRFLIDTFTYWHVSSLQKILKMEDLCKEALKKFAAQFGTDKPAKIAAFAPGRVNLIGEHTDYNDGFVFPMVRLN